MIIRPIYEPVKKKIAIFFVFTYDNIAMGRGKNEGAFDYWDRYEELASDIKDLAIDLKANIKTSTLSSWKTGKRFPPANVAVDIAEYLGVTVEYMVYGRKQPSKNEIDDKIIKLALKHKEILEIFETMDDNTLEMVIDQIMVVVRSKKRELKEVAERKEKYGEKKVT